MTDHTARDAPGYQPQWDIDYRLGRQGELFVSSIRDGLANDRTEVKTDMRALDTGRLYVEFESTNARGVWHRSGLAVTTAEVYMFVLQLDGLAVCVTTDLLRAVCRKLWPRNVHEQTRGAHRSRGVCVPIGFLLAECRKRKATP